MRQRRAIASDAADTSVLDDSDLYKITATTDDADIFLSPDSLKSVVSDSSEQKPKARGRYRLKHPTFTAIDDLTLAAPTVVAESTNILTPAAVGEAAVAIVKPATIIQPAAIAQPATIAQPAAVVEPAPIIRSASFVKPAAAVQPASVVTAAGTKPAVLKAAGAVQPAAIVTVVEPAAIKPAAEPTAIVADSRVVLATTLNDDAPGWMSEGFRHLQEVGLGLAFMECINAWVGFEESMDYGKSERKVRNSTRLYTLLISVITK